MSFGPRVLMPGAFHFEALNDGSSLSGVHPGIFRPPASPSTSSSTYLGKSTGSLHSDASALGFNAKRKRRGPLESRTFSSWDINRGDAEYAADNKHQEDAELNGLSEEKGRAYVLAGQIETPNGDAVEDGMNDSVYSDVDYRRALGPKCTPAKAELSAINVTSTASSSSSPTQTRQTNGWGSFALSTIGGVVGKVFQFCKTGVFRGFYAGGGRGYGVRTSPKQQPSTNGQVWCNEHDIPTLPNFSSNTTPIEIPQSNNFPPNSGQGSPESSPPPAAKRRQIDVATPGDELRRNWVMVQESSEKIRPQSRASQASTLRTTQQQPFSPAVRRVSRPVSRVKPPSYTRRPSSRISPAGTTSLYNLEPASFASPRAQSPVVSLHTPSRIPVPSRPQSPSVFSSPRLPETPSLIPSPSIHPMRNHRRNHSVASAASGGSTRMKRGDSIRESRDYSPRLDAEAKTLAAKRLQEDIETDMRMNDFNAKLRDMIRQGKEALGTKVDIEIHDDMEGVDTWEDDIMTA
ncbi:uncharacterized protein F4812DRAFT_288037 [Daldinia caldariorum]|uniref:uncharacterized protein n=1 Tax=Daldinia caldariorum TaxID=326644 RepID=UPI002007AE91|nr:uncharacterized protein F4812DRAFT_288037 [Daldinia caldariorum]KAI1463095.1 hypothetical protein F4812DRAFT_288037 [Daldinia caldariorum]